MNKLNTVFLGIIFLVFIIACQKDDSTNEETDIDQEQVGQPSSLEDLIQDDTYRSFVKMQIEQEYVLSDIKRYKELTEDRDNWSSADKEEFYQIIGYADYAAFKDEITDHLELIKKIEAQYDLDSYNDSEIRMIFDKTFASVLIELRNTNRNSKSSRNEDIDCYQRSYEDYYRGSGTGPCAECYEEYITTHKRLLLDYELLLLQCSQLSIGEDTDCVENSPFALDRNGNYLVFRCCLANDCEYDPETEERRCDATQSIQICSDFLSS